MSKTFDYRLSLNDTMALKGVAIIAMLCHHLFYQQQIYGVAVQQFGIVCKVCVAIFLFLSGYGLSIQYAKLQAKDQGNNSRLLETLKFLYKRYVKFYLNYWVIFLISVPISVLCFGRSLTEAYGEDANVAWCLITDFLGIRGTLSYNITWWFNRLILMLYFLFPLLYRLISRKKFGVLITVLAYFSSSVFPFALGILFATRADMINRCFNKINGKILLLGSMVAVVGLCFARQMSPIPYLHGIYLDGFIAALLAILLVSANRVYNLNLMGGAFLGKHSMNMYMLHTFVCGYFFKDFIYGFKYPILIFFVLLVITLGLSVIIEYIKKICLFYVLQNKIVTLINKK